MFKSYFIINIREYNFSPRFLSHLLGGGADETNYTLSSRALHQSTRQAGKRAVLPKQSRSHQSGNSRHAQRGSLEDKSLMVKPANNALQPAKSSVLQSEGILKTELVESQEESLSIIWERFGTMIPKLYDVESSYSEPEKSLPLDLGLDQLEDY